MTDVYLNVDVSGIFGSLSGTLYLGGLEPQPETIQPEPEPIIQPEPEPIIDLVPEPQQSGMNRFEYILFLLEMGVIDRSKLSGLEMEIYEDRNVPVDLLNGSRNLRVLDKKNK